MAQHTRKFMYCDNPTCSNREEGELEPAEGIYINRGSIHTNSGGVSFAKVYACSEKCIGPAVVAAGTESWETGQVRKKW